MSTTDYKWSDLFNHDINNRTPEWIFALPREVNVCKLCGALVHDNTDWMHIDFHNRLNEPLRP